MEPVNPVQPTQQATSGQTIVQRGLLLPVIVVALLLLIVGVGAYYLGRRTQSVPQQSTTPQVAVTSPTIPDSTANWQTYTNQKYNFAIKYPSDWKYIEVPNNKYQTQYDGVWLLPKSSTPPLPNSDGLTVPIALQLSTTDPSINPQFIDNYKSESYLIGILQGKRITGTSKAGMAIDEIVIKANTFYIDAKTHGANFDQILSTFKFTDSTQVTDTSNWKTYASAEYSFAMMYPPQVTHEETLSSTQFNKSHEFFRVDGGTLEIYGVCGRGVQPVKQQDIIIGGQKATKLYATNTNGVITAIPRPNSNESICFNFTLPNDLTKTSSVDALFDKILSTFKFTQ